MEDRAGEEADKSDDVDDTGEGLQRSEHQDAEHGRRVRDDSPYEKSPKNFHQLFLLILMLLLFSALSALFGTVGAVIRRSTAKVSLEELADEAICPDVCNSNDDDRNEEFYETHKDEA